MTEKRHPNLLPPGWHEIDEKAFAQSMFFTYTGEQEYGGTMYPALAHDPSKPDFHAREGVVHAAKMFNFHDGTGIALVRDYWAGTVKFYKYGCEHAYRELSQAECRERGIYHAGNCWHVMECPKCSYINSYDSS